MVTILAFSLFNWGHKIPNALTPSCGKECFSYITLMRVSLALVLYHAFFSLILFGVRNTLDWRAWLQNGLWFPKLLLLLGSFLLVFYGIPNEGMYGYHIPALVFSALFMLLQSFLLVDFAWQWAQRWIESWEDSGDVWYRNMLIFCCFLFHSVSFALSVYLLYDYGPPRREGCGLNSYFVAMNMVLVVIQSVVSVLPAIQESTPKSGLFQASFLGLYTTYLTASAIFSEPNQEGFQCSAAPATGDEIEKSPLHNVMVYSGILLTFVALGYSAFSTGSSSFFMEPVAIDEEGNTADGSNDDEADVVVYDYSYFHFTMVLAAFYMAMIVSDWSVAEGTAPGSQEDIKIVHGFGAMWAKIVMSWLCTVLYLWTLVAPLIFPDRDFNI